MCDEENEKNWQHLAECAAPWLDLTPPPPSTRAGLFATNRGIDSWPGDEVGQGGRDQKILNLLYNKFLSMNGEHDDATKSPVEIHEQQAQQRRHGSVSQLETGIESPRTKLIGQKNHSPTNYWKITLENTFQRLSNFKSWIQKADDKVTPWLVHIGLLEQRVNSPTSPSIPNEFIKGHITHPRLDWCTEVVSKPFYPYTLSWVRLALYLNIFWLVSQLISIPFARSSCRNWENPWWSPIKPCDYPGGGVCIRHDPLIPHYPFNIQLTTNRQYPWDMYPCAKTRREFHASHTLSYFPNIASPSSTTWLYHLREHSYPPNWSFYTLSNKPQRNWNRKRRHGHLRVFGGTWFPPR
jgi:hypothetical protein